MSGLKNEPVTSGNFLNFKDGKIISAVNGSKEEYTAIEGKLTELDIVDENYQGKDYRKIVLFITDDDGTTWKLGFPLESGYGNAFCSLALNIDYTKDVKISGGTKDLDNGKSYGMLFVRQLGGDGKMQPLKWHFKNDSTELPAGEKKKDRTGEYTDYSARNDYFHRMLIEEIRPAILQANGTGVKKEEAKGNPLTQVKTTQKASKKGF